MWVTAHPEELQPFEKGFIFGPFMNLRARVSLSLTRTHDVISSPLELKICECTKKSTRIQIHAKNDICIVSTRCVRALRARAENFEMLKMT